MNVYVDHAATTQMCKEAVDAFVDCNNTLYGNASSRHSFGKLCEGALIESKEIIADSINASPEEIYFTSGGSESNNWAIRHGIGKGIVTSCVEHPSVINMCKNLDNFIGTSVSYVPVDSSCTVNKNDISNAINGYTKVVSIMYANNEVGTIQPIDEIGNMLYHSGIIFHTDAVQAYMNIPIDVQKSHIDMMSASAHKFGGAKGVGFLYVRDGVWLQPFIFGGEQQNGYRAGTYNIPGIVATAEAVRVRRNKIEENNNYLAGLRNRFIGKIMNSKIENMISFNGGKIDSPCGSLAGTINISIDGIDGETMQLMLSGMGVYCSTGSACSSNRIEPSYVLKAMGLNDKKAMSAIRISFGLDNTAEDVDYVCDSIIKAYDTIKYMESM